MDHFRIVGDPPEGGLSGLACALLWQLRGNVQTPPMPAEQLLRIPGAARVLETEDPKLLLAWLEEQEEEITSSRILPLKALLDIRKEVDYEL